MSDNAFYKHTAWLALLSAGSAAQIFLAPQASKANLRSRIAALQLERAADDVAGISRHCECCFDVKHSCGSPLNRHPYFVGVQG